MPILTDSDAERVLRAWRNANAEPEPPSPVCPRCGGQHQLCATCPACGLTGIPVCADGQLAAHGWARGGTMVDGPIDAEGNPTPGEWVGGCSNRDPGALRPRHSER